MTFGMLGLGILVFSAMCLLDYAATRYVLAVSQGDAHRAARWSVIQWSASTVGFIVAVKVSLYLLPFEALGLYCGTLLALKNRPLTIATPRDTTISK